MLVSFPLDVQCLGDRELPSTYLLSDDTTGQTPKRVNVFGQPFRGKQPAGVPVDEELELRIDLDQMGTCFLEQLARRRRRLRRVFFGRRNVLGLVGVRNTPGRLGRDQRRVRRVRLGRSIHERPGRMLILSQAVRRSHQAHSGRCHRRLGPQRRLAIASFCATSLSWRYLLSILGTIALEGWPCRCALTLPGASLR